MPTPVVPRSRLAILARIDYLGSLALLITISSTLLALSYKYNLNYPTSSPYVWGYTTSAVAGGVGFVVVETCVVPEPVLAPHLLRMKVPLLVGLNSLLVPLCNFSVRSPFSLRAEQC